MRFLHFLLGLLLLAGCLGETWRSFPPEPKKEVRVDVPIFRQHHLDNGLTLIHYETRSVPQTVVKLVLRVGSAAEPEDKGGLLWLWFSSLAEADLEEQRALDLLGEVPHAEVEPTESTLTMTVATQDSGATLAVLAKMIRTAQIAPDIWERRRSRQLVLLRAGQADPFKVAARVLRKALYGSRHPLTQPDEGTLASVAPLLPKDLEALHQKYIGPSNLAVIIVGAVNEAEALSFTQKAFGDWHAEVEQPPPISPAGPVTQRKVYFVPQRGLGQSVVTIGGLAPPADDPDELPFRLGAVLLAGRINGRLRGYDNVSYGVRLRIFSAPHSGHFSISAAVEPEATAASLETMMSQSFMLAMSGFSVPTMPYLRLGAIWDMTASFNTLLGTAEAAGALYCLGRPIDYSQLLLKSIPNITYGQVYEAVRHYLERDHFQVVVVGDDAIANQVAKLQLGALEIERSR